VEGGIYRVLAQVSTPAGSSVVELFSDDNVAQDGKLHRFVNAAGQANLVVGNAGDTLPNLIVPGDTGMVKVALTNNASASAQGVVDVKFFLSESTATDPNADVLDSGDRQIGAIIGKTIDLAGGKSVVLSTNLQVPQTLDLAQGEYYRILAEVTTPQGSTVTDALSSDNVMTNGSVHQLINAFGTFSFNGQARTGA
jgi:hypothetical protein